MLDHPADDLTRLFAAGRLGGRDTAGSDGVDGTTGDGGADPPGSTATDGGAASEGGRS